MSAGQVPWTVIPRDHPHRACALRLTNPMIQHWQRWPDRSAQGSFLGSNSSLDCLADYERWGAAKCYGTIRRLRGRQRIVGNSFGIRLNSLNSIRQAPPIWHSIQNCESGTIRNHNRASGSGGNATTMKVCVDPSRAGCGFPAHHIQANTSIITSDDRLRWMRI